MTTAQWRAGGRQINTHTETALGQFKQFNNKSFVVVASGSAMDGPKLDQVHWLGSNMAWEPSWREQSGRDVPA